MKKNAGPRAIILFLATLACSSSIARAYGHAGPGGGAHRLINELALRTFAERIAPRDPILARYDFYPTAAKYNLGAEVDDRLFATEGWTVSRCGKLTCRERLVRNGFAWWVREGGFTADAPEIPMGMRHFFDPTMNGGAAWLTDIVGPLGPHMDARTWALAGSPHSWQVGEESLRQALAEKDPARQSKLYAKAWRCLGETMHILTDLTNPAHVRNDGHVFREPYEKDYATGAWITGFLADPGSDWRLPQLRQDAIGRCASPSALFALVATHVNAHFFSNDTIAGLDPDSGKRMRSRNGERDYPSPRLEECTYDPATRCYTATDEAGRIIMAARPARGTPFVNEACAHSQAERLVPLAVAANARLLAMCLPGLEVRIEAIDSRTMTLSGRVIAYGRDTNGEWKPARGTSPFGDPAGVIVILTRAGATAPAIQGYRRPVSLDGRTGRFTLDLGDLPLGPAPTHAGTGPDMRLAAGIVMGGILVKSEEIALRM